MFGGSKIRLAVHGRRCHGPPGVLHTTIFVDPTAPGSAQNIIFVDLMAPVRILQNKSQSGLPGVEFFSVFTRLNLINIVNMDLQM